MCARRTAPARATERRRRGRDDEGTHRCRPNGDLTEVTEAVATIDNGTFGTRTIRFETGRLAKQAAGSVVAYLDEDTMLLSATTAGKNPREGFDFFPLTVDVEERMYAAGRIPGSFFRREGRPSEDAILTCRLIDRPLRPTFIKGLRNEVQVVITVMALNPDHAYDVLAINAASASTQISGLPFNGPVGGTRVALIDGQWVGFPTHTELERATFDMVVAGRRRSDSRRRRDHDGRGRGHRERHRADRRRRHPADRGGRRRRASRRPSRSSPSCAARRPSWPRPPPSRPRSSRSSSTTRTTCSTRSSAEVGRAARARR